MGLLRNLVLKGPSPGPRSLNFFGRGGGRLLGLPPGGLVGNFLQGLYKKGASTITNTIFFFGGVLIINVM